MADQSATTEMLDAHVDQGQVAGGCDHCAATQTMHRESEGIYRLAIAHDTVCPVLAHHTRIAPLAARLAELRRQWRMWKDVDPEELAQREDLEFDDMYPEALGDRVLAARMFRAGVMAQIRELGHGLAEQLAAERERAVAR